MILNNFVSGEYFVLSVVKDDFAWLLQLQWTIAEMLHKSTVVCWAFSSIFFRSISCQVGHLDWFFTNHKGPCHHSFIVFQFFTWYFPIWQVRRIFLCVYVFEKYITWLFYLFGTVNNDIIPHPSLRESSISLSHVFPLIHRSC